MAVEVFGKYLLQIFVLLDDTEIGIQFAKQTLAGLKGDRMHQGILAKILEQAPTNCLIAKGSRMEIENILFQLVFQTTQQQVIKSPTGN